MLREHSQLVRAGLRVGDVAILVVSLPATLAVEARLFPGTAIAAPERPWQLLALTLAAWSVFSWFFQVYDFYRNRSLGTEARRIGRALVAVGVLVWIARAVPSMTHLPRLLLVTYYGVSLALLLASRLVVRGIARASRRRGFNSRYYAVVGSGELAREAVRAMASHPEWGYVLAGLVLEDEAATPPPGVPVLGTLADMGTVLERQVLDQVTFAVPPARLVAIEGAARLCQEQGLSVSVCLDLLPGAGGRMVLAQLDGIPLLAFTTVPGDALALAAKRAFDVVVSAAVLLLSSPVLAAVAVAIALDSPGPVLFRQRRVGLNGREFMLLKFRSMCLDAEAQLPALRTRNEMSGPVFKMRNDPRVTRVGRFIRRTSLDEFPQFWNVLRGEMSVVGPRPPVPEEVTRYQRWQRRRLSVKPGITCTWQVSGRNEIDFDRWMRLDLHYIDNWSLLSDLHICVKTLPAVLSSRGAR